MRDARCTASRSLARLLVATAVLAGCAEVTNPPLELHGITPNRASTLAVTGVEITGEHFYNGLYVPLDSPSKVQRDWQVSLAPPR